MKVRPHPLVLLVTLLAVLLVAASGASAASPDTSTDQQSKQATAAADDKDSSAAERREARSEFEREKLDPEAFGDSSKEEASKDEGSDSGGSFLRFIFGLVVVLAVIYGVHWVLKRWGQSRLQGVAGNAGIIDVVATTPLAQGRTLHLIRVGQELVLVGATEQSITRIGEMDAARMGELAADRGNGEFQAMLNGAMIAGQPGVPAGMGGTSSANEPFLKRFLDNLRMSTAR